MRKQIIEKRKEKYMSLKAEELTIDYGFIKGFTLDIINEYYKFLIYFLENYKKKINDLLSKSEILSNDIKSDYMLEQINFIVNIPKLIKVHGNDFDVDFVFLEEHFLKLKTQKEISELHKNLDELQKEIDISSNFNVKELYFFGNFILSFLTEFEFRKKIIIELLQARMESKKNDFKDIIDPKFIKNENSTSNWNVTNL